MKIVWHSLTGLEKQSQGYRRSLEAHLKQVAAEGTEVEFMGSPRGDGVNYRSFKLLDEAEVLKNLLRLRQRNDVDAVAVGNSYDVAVQEAREILDIPVLGFTETAILVSHLVAESFAIVAGTDKFATMYRGNVRERGLETHLTGMYTPPPEISLGDLLAAFDDEELRSEVAKEFSRLAREGIEDGAEIILPGGGAAPTLINYLEGIEQIDGVPVMDATAVLLKITETMATLYELGAVETSKKAMYRPPDTEFLEELESIYEI